MKPSLSGRKRRWLAVATLAVATVALAPVVVARSGSGAAAATGMAAPAPTDPTTVGAPVESAVTASTAAETPTTTAAPTTTTTTTATTTPTIQSTATAAATTTTTVAAAERSAASVAPTQLEQVEAIADAAGFDWRAAGVTIHIGYNPDACCHWGIYDYRDNSLWIGPTAFASPTRLRYVVLHELGHAWQWATGQRGQLAADLAPWGYSGTDALEYGADCVATIWGAQTDHYWSCPAAAQAVVSRRLSGDWN
jgi:hypothetical protein